MARRAQGLSDRLRVAVAQTIVIKKGRVAAWMFMNTDGAARVGGTRAAAHKQGSSDKRVTSAFAADTVAAQPESARTPSEVWLHFFPSRVSGGAPRARRGAGAAAPVAVVRPQHEGRARRPRPAGGDGHALLPQQLRGLLLVLAVPRGVAESPSVRLAHGGVCVWGGGAHTRATAQAQAARHVHPFVRSTIRHSTRVPRRPSRSPPRPSSRSPPAHGGRAGGARASLRGGRRVKDDPSAAAAEQLSVCLQDVVASTDALLYIVQLQCVRSEPDAAGHGKRPGGGGDGATPLSRVPEGAPTDAGAHGAGSAARLTSKPYIPKLLLASVTAEVALSHLAEVRA